MRHLFIMNPHAGKFDRSQEMLEKIRHIMAGAGRNGRRCGQRDRATPYRW